VHRINPTTRVEGIDLTIDEKNVLELGEGCDVILDAMDNFSANLINATIGTIKSLTKNLSYLIRRWTLPFINRSVSQKPRHVLTFILSAIPLLYLLLLDVSIILQHLAFTVIAFILTLTCLMQVRARVITDHRKTKGFSLLSISKMLYYVLLNEYIVILAWKDLSIGNYSVLWDKAETTRPSVFK